MNTGQHAVLAGVVFIADIAGLQGEERVVLAHANVRQGRCGCRTDER